MVPLQRYARAYAPQLVCVIIITAGQARAGRLQTWCLDKKIKLAAAVMTLNASSVV